MFANGRWTVVLVLAGCVGGPAWAGDVAVLWNKLGSEQEVFNSAHGPNLRFFTEGGGLEQPANHEFAPGYFGNAVTIGPGSYQLIYRYHNVVFDNLPAYLSPERGTIETWYKQMTDPVAYDHNPYRIFDGSFGLNSGMFFESQGDSPDGPRLRFGLVFGGQQVEVYAQDGKRGYNISPRNKTWIHIAGTWDRQGIDGTGDKLRLYVDGQVAAKSTDSAWGTTIGSRADICGANDQNIARQFYMDNLKVWDHAVTDDFSHRFQENWIPEPGTFGLLLVGGLVIRRYRRG